MGPPRYHGVQHALLRHAPLRYLFAAAARGEGRGRGSAAQGAKQHGLKSGLTLINTYIYIYIYTYIYPPSLRPPTAIGVCEASLPHDVRDGRVCASKGVAYRYAHTHKHAHTHTHIYTPSEK